MVKSFKKDKLAVNIYENRTLMGEAAANDIAACMEKLLAEKDTINMVFAAAPSQNDVLKSLVEDKEIEWNRVNAYHMDEYIGLGMENKDKSFSCYLTDHIFGKETVTKFRNYTGHEFYLFYANKESLPNQKSFLPGGQSVQHCRLHCC